MRKIGNLLRRMGTFTVLLLLTGLLCGCHGSGEQEDFAVPETFDESKNYEITFWAKNDTNKNQTNVYEKAIRDFEALYPNIKVNMRLYTDYGKIYNDVITNISTGTTPNVCITYPDHIATYITGGNTVAPLDELFADPKYGFGGSELRYDGPTHEEMVEKYLEEGKIGERSFAIPYMRSSEVLYINKTYVEALGYEVPDVPTWDFIWEVSEAAMAKDAAGNYAVNGQKVLIPFIYKSTDNMLITMLRQQEAGYSDEAGNIELFNDTTDALLKEIAAHAKSGAFSTFKISGYPANFLNAGQCIFAIDSTAGATWMGTHAPLCDISADKLVEFETVVRPLPQFDPEHPKMISQGPSICIFNKADPDQVLASWLFAQYMLTDEVQVGYAKTEGYVPVTKKALESEAYQDYVSRSGEDNNVYYYVKLDASRLIIEHTEDTFTTPVFNGSASLRDAAGYLIENVCKSVRRKITVDEAYMQKLYADTTSLYRLDQSAGMMQVDHDSLGPLPGAAKALLITLAVCWIGIVIVAVRRLKRQKK